MLVDCSIIRLSTTCVSYTREYTCVGTLTRELHMEIITLKHHAYSEVYLIG